MNNSPNSNKPKPEEAPPTLPHATQKSPDDNPPLYIVVFDVMGQSVPDMATGSTPVTRHDD